MVGRVSGIIVIIMHLLSGSALGQDFYFGGYSNQVKRFENIGDNYQGEADTIKAELGFNMLFGSSLDSEYLIKLGTNQGFYTFPAMYRADGSVSDDYKTLVTSNYAIVEAEDETHSVRFTIKGGAGDTSGFYYAPLDSAEQDSIFLSGLSFRRWLLNEEDDNTWFYYAIKVDIRPDSSFYEISEGDPIGFLIVNYDTLSIVYHPDSTGIRVYKTNDAKMPSGEWAYVKIGTYQRCTFGIDWYKIYNANGKDLVEQHIFPQQVIDFADAYTDTGNVVYWYFHDEPRYTNWLPDSVWRYEFNQEGHRGASVYSYGVGQKIPREYVELGNPEIMFADVYPLNGGQICTTYTTAIEYNEGSPPDTTIDTAAVSMTKTAYTGSDSASSGLQYILDKNYIGFFDSLYAAASENNLYFWVLAQAFGTSYNIYTDTTVTYPEDADSIVIITDRDCNDEDWMVWRKPTKSELSALTFMAMCYDIKGLVYWRYDSWNRIDEHSEGITKYTSDGSRDSDTTLWNALKDNISPYVKAYGEIYADTLLDFQLDRTYSVNETRDPPAGAFISSITYWSESTNPDSGWLQVGEFHDSNSDKYIMLVNRACNIDSLNLAPDLSCNVRLDASVIDTNYVYIINIADIAYYDTLTSTWVAIPDTTYSAKMPDGTIPFTTVLGPGEGRLFKIVATEQ